MNYEDIAIGDMLQHPVFRLVTYSPDLTEKKSDNIIVRTGRGNIAEVKASDCEPVSKKDKEKV